CITSIVGPQTGRHRRHGFSGGRFPICLKACCHRLTSCPCPGNVVRPSRQVIEEAWCPGLSGYPLRLMILSALLSCFLTIFKTSCALPITLAGVEGRSPSSNGG